MRADKILQINTFRGQPCLGTLTKLLCLGMAVLDCFRGFDWRGRQIGAVKVYEIYAIVLQYLHIRNPGESEY